MRNFLILLTLALPLILFSACGKKEATVSTLEKIKTENKIVVGTKIDSKPFCYKENGVLKGYDIDLAKLVAKRLLNEENPNIEFVELRAMDRIYALNAKQVDIVIASMSITPQRNEVIEFSKPYYVAGQVLLINKNSKTRSIKDLDNKAVGIVLGSTGESTIRYFLPEAKIQSAKTYPEIFDLLKNKKVDAVLADDSMLYSIFRGNQNFKILPKRYTKEFYAIAIRKDDLDLKSKIDAIITNLQENGSLNNLKAKWL